MDAFVADMNLMFNNAQEYNADESEIFIDAKTLQVDRLQITLTQEKLNEVAKEERTKDDSEYINRGLAKDPKIIDSGGVDGAGGKMQRIPIGYVEANGERYEIGSAPQESLLM
jgi:Bromodomain